MIDFPQPQAGSSTWPWISGLRKELDANELASLPSISIVTPSYNQGEFLEETLRSVLCQQYPKLQYVVIDGGSTDQSVEIIGKYEKWIDYWVSEPDRGQADALNKGFQRCTGDIFCFLNSDDVYCEGAFFHVADAYLNDKHRENSLLAFCVEDFDGASTLKLTRPKANHRLVDWLDGLVSLHQPGVFWARKLHHRLGGFDSSYRFDFDRKFFMAAITQNARICANPTVVTTRFRRHPASKTEMYFPSGGFDAELARVSTETRATLGFWHRAVGLHAQRVLSRRDRATGSLRAKILAQRPSWRVIANLNLLMLISLSPLALLDRMLAGHLRRCFLPTWRP